MWLRGPGNSNPDTDIPRAETFGQAPDQGPWTLNLHIPSQTGVYVARAACGDVGTGQTVVEYQAMSFTVVPG